MNSSAFEVLIVDDEPAVARYLASLLPLSQCRAEIALSGQGCLSRIKARDSKPDVVFLDADMPEMDGFTTLRQLRRLNSDVPVVMMSCQGGPDHTMEAWRAGAQGFLQKPILGSDIMRMVSKHCAARSHAVELERVQQPHIEELLDGQFFLAASAEMRAITRQASTLSKADVPVLITGESGVGKEVVAQLLHHHSPRASRQLLKVNCAALPQDLLESELFGYEAGA